MGKKSRIAVAGLNPHAGENNAFGSEDTKEIAPAVQLAIREGIDAQGPMAADTVFYQARKGMFDAVVCMYHDQGHIPIKLLEFESAVNITLGLPFIRTSVDHGTAFDIAYRGNASLTSFCNAFDMAKILI
jgi:4-hydroxythreonine-4-phosphate dehydrogenase